MTNKCGICETEFKNGFIQCIKCKTYTDKVDKIINFKTIINHMNECLKPYAIIDVRLDGGYITVEYPDIIKDVWKYYWTFHVDIIPSPNKYISFQLNGIDLLNKINTYIKDAVPFEIEGEGLCDINNFTDLSLQSFANEKHVENLDPDT